MGVISGAETEVVDVIVVGSGATGLTAALTALDRGATVAVFEKSDHIGGTSAISGGMVWIPGNHLQPEADRELDAQSARGYMERVTEGRADPALLGAHIARGDALLQFLAATSDLRFASMSRFPDYHPELEGGSPGGRSIEPEMYDTTVMGDLARAVRPDPRPPFMQQEYFEQWRTYRDFPWALLNERQARGIVARGGALVAPLLRAVAGRGASVVTGVAVERLNVDADGVQGIRAGGRDYVARQGVVLACGGFEWNDDLCARFLSGPVMSRCSPPNQVGDGLRMAMAVGADLAGLNEAWWSVQADVPGVESEGRGLGTIVTVERSLPGAIIVNRYGQRFVNESGSYYDIGKIFATFDQHTYGYRNLPAHLIVDSRFVERYGLLGVDDLGDAPGWVATGATLTALAEAIGVDPAGLEQTVERFNAHAREGVDPDFHRGETVYARYFGDASAPHPNLGPLEVGPFAAVELNCGAIGTKGGPRTDVEARVLDPWGQPIPGLFAVGNCAAHPLSFGYVGAGATLGPGMTMAWAAGEAVLEERGALVS